VNFTSDNTYGVAAPIMDAIVAVNYGAVGSYGGDPWTARVVCQFCELFEREVKVFLLPSGTAANALAISSLTPPHGAVFCHNESHILLEECGACEFYSSGARLVPVSGFAGRMMPLELNAAIAKYSGIRNDLIPAALSITQSTECGTVYQPDAVAELCSIAHKRGMAVHMDGARFANSVVSLGLPPAAVTWRAGIDILSFGATKNGALAAEAVIVFDTDRASDLIYRCKRAGLLLSKMRFVAAQWEAYLADGLWLRLAGHANTMARQLADGLRGVADVRLPWPTDANEVFCLMAGSMVKRLRDAGASFHEWTTVGLYASPFEPTPDEVFVRLVTSFQTTQDQIDIFLKLAADD